MNWHGWAFEDCSRLAVFWGARPGHAPYRVTPWKRRFQNSDQWKLQEPHSRVKHLKCLRVCGTQRHWGPLRSCSVWEQLSEICSLSQTILRCLRGKLTCPFRDNTRFAWREKLVHFPNLVLLPNIPKSSSVQKMSNRALFFCSEVVKSLSKDDNKTLLQIAGPLVERMPLDCT